MEVWIFYHNAVEAIAQGPPQNFKFLSIRPEVTKSTYQRGASIQNNMYLDPQLPSKGAFPNAVEIKRIRANSVEVLTGFVAVHGLTVAVLRSIPL